MKLTAKEKAWIDGVKKALKNCPDGISINIDCMGGDDVPVEFWKEEERGSHIGVGKSCNVHTV